MRELLEIYAQQFRTTFASFVQYRASILIWMIWHILEPLVYLVVWTTVSRSHAGSVGGFTGGDLAAYFIAMMLVNHVTYTWIIYEYEYRIRHGSLSFALLRPLHPMHADIVANISSKLITLPMMIAAAAVLAFVFRPVFRFEFWQMLLFVPALLLAFMIRFLVEWTLALVAFWTTRVSAVNQGYYIASLFLSGQMAPLALLPFSLRIASALLPFRWMISFPVELALGRMSLPEAFAGLGAQLAWLCVSLLLMRRVWQSGVRRYSAVGA
ncbi:MAG TPA: ABC-2 family transporter protein [Bacteroidota bacterium]|nr:ABC-2 family transporter protein [Bacteroidota bacterium]